MVTRRFSAADGTSLCADLYEPAVAGPPEGVVVIVHGYCEHRGRYRETAAQLAGCGYRVVVGDLRGHGESGGKRAYVQRFQEYEVDLQAMLDQAGAQDGRPPLLVGHSMGGLIALRYMIDRPGQVRALALSSPFWA